MPPARLLPRKVLGLSSRVLVPTFSVVSLVPVCSPSTIRSNSSCSAKPSRVDLVSRLDHSPVAKGRSLKSSSKQMDFNLEESWSAIDGQRVMHKAGAAGLF